ncbi:MAG: type II secretion system GspH family protein [Rhodocyclaceae bacterium]|nr:type II secretion system GspH family protein [Rhodocyclaceae bacterium]
MRRQGAFTLVEMVVVIAITGIIAAVVAVFLRAPAEGYAASSRRAWMTDVADTALRRIARDVRAALPNSLRPYGTTQAIEMLVTSTGGRYNQDAAEQAGCFSSGCSELRSLGSVLQSSGEYKGQRLVIYNLHPNDDNSCSASNPSAWCGNNSAEITNSIDNSDEDTLSFTLTAFRPSTGSPSRAFFIVSGPVAYECSDVGESNGNGTGKLYRYEGYPITATSTLPPPPTTQRRLLAEYVSGCSFTYSPGVTERSGLLVMKLELLRAGERVVLMHQVHVDNAP